MDRRFWSFWDIARWKILRLCITLLCYIFRIELGSFLFFCSADQMRSECFSAQRAFSTFPLFRFISEGVTKMSRNARKSTPEDPNNKKITSQFARSQTQLNIFRNPNRSYLPNQLPPGNNKHMQLKLMTWATTSCGWLIFEKMVCPSPQCTF